MGCEISMLYVLLDMSATGDDRPESVDLEVMRVQNGSPVPSLALTDTDFGGKGEPETGRATLLRSAGLALFTDYTHAHAHTHH